MFFDGAAAENRDDAIGAHLASVHSHDPLPQPEVQAVEPGAVARRLGARKLRSPAQHQDQRG